MAGTPDELLDLLVGHIERRNAAGIAAGIGRLITSGELPEGTRLPTVRELARTLGVSPTTVSDAWGTLAAIGAIEARGRLGSHVRRNAGPGGGQRYRRVTEGPGHFAIDLSTGTPDPLLLPDLSAAVAAIGGRDLTTTYVDPPVLPDLEDQLRRTWPFTPEAVTVVDGAMDALDRIASQVVRHGDRVVVEDPTFPPVLDLLERLGAEVIGVPLDEEGMRVGELRAALDRRPSMVFLQPRAQNPTGITLTARRAADLAEVLSGTDVIVVEDDHSGDIAAGELTSIGARLPRQTVHIRGYSKSHGPDLRLAAVGGAGAVVQRVVDRRLLGPAWSSRILQAVLVAMLEDPATVALVASARTAYAARRRAFAEELAALGVPTGGTDGINLWVPVADQERALVTLAAQGIGAAPGAPFQVRSGDPHLRLTIGQIADPAIRHRLAAQVAEAAGGAGAASGWPAR